jgi:hypothetical protein
LRTRINTVVANVEWEIKAHCPLRPGQALRDQMSFFQAFVYLLAAVISVPLAKRLGLGSVLGYLLAGVVIGPFGLVGSAHGDVMHIAEFGVV